jgi:3D-(3,5/4)-trihydroxycyclohexane-1,2-dione acylhydrolase (decyclizing)
VDVAYRERLAALRREWHAEVDRVTHLGHGPLMSQAEVIGALNEVMAPTDVIVNAAGSAPGDLHKLWRSSDPKAFHLEYGYSCMGYEIPGGLGVKLAAPEREVVVLIGDGSWLMMSADLSTAIQEGVKLTVVLVDNHGFASIGALSQSLGSKGFGTELRMRQPGAGHSGPKLGIDYVANAASLGARALRAANVEELRRAMLEARGQPDTTVIVVETDRSAHVPGYESWWDVPVSEISSLDEVRAARAKYEQAVRRERAYHAESRK